MSKLRSVNTHFWSDNYIIELDPVERLLFLYLLTNEHTNVLGIYEIHPRKITFDTGIDQSRVKAILEKFQDDTKVSYIKGYVVLHNFLKNQRMNENMNKSAISTFKELPAQVRSHPSMKGIREALGGISDDITNIVVKMSRREAMFVKYRGVCQYCKEEIKTSGDLEADHVHPLSKGGSDTYDNLVLSCRECNQKKLDKLPEELGWERPSTGDYHFNSARKDLLEIDWLREKFNSVFNRELVIIDDNLTQVNHKHRLNKEQQLSNVNHKHRLNKGEQTINNGKQKGKGKGKGKLESESEREEETKESVATHVDDAPPGNSGDDAVDEQTWEQAVEVSRYLMDSIIALDPDHKYANNPPSLNRWHIEIDRSIRLDGRTKDQLKFIINYVFKRHTPTADFWKSNIQSGQKLRQHFDQIKTQIKTEVKNGKPSSSQIAKNTVDQISKLEFEDA